MNATLITLAEASRLMPAKQNGKRISTRTLARWISHGCYGVRLQAQRFGRDWFTCPLWMEQFLAAISTSHDPNNDPPPMPHLRARAAHQKILALKKRA